MDLYSNSPLWPVADGLLHSYPPLTIDERCDVLVLGAGITGAILAERFTREGLDVVVLDRRDVAHGSTSASTALLQYEIDTHLCDLIDLVGREHAERAYRLCLHAIDTIGELAAGIPGDCGFRRRQSIYVANNRKQVRQLEREHEARRACNIEVELVTQPELGYRFPLQHPAALVSAAGASCDPYRLAHGLLQLVLRRGGRVYDRTEATEILAQDGGILARTQRGTTVKARRIVYATGYEAQERLQQRVVTLKSTYAFASQPLADLAPWREDWLLWEVDRPYLYLRATADRRILAGGRDDSFRSPRLRDGRVERRSEQLLRQVKKILPDLPLEVEFAWAGTFGETEDGLAYIGASPEQPNAYFALGFGGNGITFSATAADLLVDQLLGRPNPDAAIFRFDR